ncbi:hypothetical protein CEXT_147931 [Caerostris extrusa]|uniref:Uncharacterized protein n=1 Tax=Caerostris extrusa TaxID=172846 RepID=A0AAV4Y7A5_CAEEX|nr:hypothetical protein CEXT_147931 [Caerostris extrusa]
MYDGSGVGSNYSRTLCINQAIVFIITTYPRKLRGLRLVLKGPIDQRIHFQKDCRFDSINSTIMSPAPRKPLRALEHFGDSSLVPTNTATLFKTLLTRRRLNSSKLIWRHLAEDRDINSSHSYHGHTTTSKQ